MIVEPWVRSRGSGGADLNGGAESHEPSPQWKDSLEPGAKGAASVLVDFLKEFVQLEPLDAEPLVSAGDVGTQLTAWLRVGWLVVPALSKDAPLPQDGRTRPPACHSRFGLHTLYALLYL